MTTLTLSVAVATALLAALLHVYIFVLESLRWQEPATRKVFGTTAEIAEVTAPLAYNQGFYNLFLAIGSGLGALLAVAGERSVGMTLLVFATGSMLAAALVLALSDGTKLRAAVTQGLFPLVAVVAAIAWCLS